MGIESLVNTMNNCHIYETCFHDNVLSSMGWKSLRNFSYADFRFPTVKGFPKSPLPFQAPAGKWPSFAHFSSLSTSQFKQPGILLDFSWVYQCIPDFYDAFLLKTQRPGLKFPVFQNWRIIPVRKWLITMVIVFVP